MKVIKVAAGVALAIWVTALSGCAPVIGTSIEGDAAIVKRSATPAALKQHGDVAAAVGDFTRAEQYYSAALAAGGDSRVLVRRLLEACVQDRRYRLAVDYAERHLRLDPGDVEVRFAMANLYAAIADGQMARQNFEKVLRQRPDDAEAHLAYARLLGAEGTDQPLADEHLRAYLRLCPDCAHIDQARAALDEGRAAGALAQ